MHVQLMCEEPVCGESIQLLCKESICGESINAVMGWIMGPSDYWTNIHWEQGTDKQRVDTYKMAA
jgi:hypothetical protein